MKKFNNKLINVKSTSLEVSDMDFNSRMVSGYLSVFDNIDSHDEIMKKGCYEDSIKSKGPRSTSNRKIAHLFDHDLSQPIGVFTELFEDEKGLKFVSKIGRSRVAEDVFKNYQDGILREHSVGFYYMPEFIKEVSISDNTFYELYKVDLLEGSTVTLGSNSLTRVLTVSKSEDRMKILETINEEMDILTNALNNEGKDILVSSDERLKDIDLQLQILKAKYNELIDLDKLVSVKDVSKDIENVIKGNDKRNAFLDKLINIYK